MRKSAFKAVPGASKAIRKLAKRGDTVASLLTQAAARVYLRDKEPNLSYLKRDRNFILVYPREFST